MSVNLAVIPVAGRGTRLLPLTKSQPKEMLPLGRRPVVQSVVEELFRCGVDRMVLVTGPGKTAIENHFDIDPELIDHLRTTGKEDELAELAFERDEIQYFYTRQRRQLGLGHAVLCAESLVREPFVVALGDSVLGRNAQSLAVRRMTRLFEEYAADAAICFREVPTEQVVRYGVARPSAERILTPEWLTAADTAGCVTSDTATDASSDACFVLEDIVEKPSVAEAPSRLAVAARYVFHPKIFEYLHQTPPGKNGEIQLTDAIRLLLRDGGRVLGLRLTDADMRFDVGNFRSYYQAFVEFALADPTCGADFERWLRERLA